MAEIKEVAVLQPGDRVLIHVADDVTQEWANSMIAALRRRFPDVEFTVVWGPVESVTVAGAAADPGATDTT